MKLREYKGWLMNYKEFFTGMAGLLAFSWKPEVIGADLSFRWGLTKRALNALQPGITQLNWFFTGACNFSCYYCNSRGGKDNGLAEKEQGLELIVKRFRPKVLNITGGEPTLKFEELLGFIRHAKALGIFTVTLNTNGSRLDNEKLEGLADAGLSYISFSYDGIPPKEDKSVFEKAIYAGQLGIVPIIQPVFSSRNWHLRDEIAGQCDGVAFFNPTIVNNLGLDYSSREAIPPAAEEVRAFFAKMASWSSWSRTSLSNPFFSYLSKNYGTPYKCNDSNWITVGSDGRLKHCSEFGTDFSIGDLADEHKFASFQELRKGISGSCPGCYYACFFMSDGSPLGKVGPGGLLKILVQERYAHTAMLVRLLNEQKS